MNFYGRMHLGVVLGLVLASTGSQALGGIVTYTASTPLKQLTDFNASLSVTGFNATLGTLESVVLSLSDEAFVQGTLFNKAAESQDFSITQDVNFGVKFGGSQVLTNDLSASKNYTGVASGTSVNFGLFSLTGSTGDVTMLSPAFLAALTSNTPVTFDFSTLTSTTIGGKGGNTTTSFHTTADATLTVTYNYIGVNLLSIVPEPASIAMTALGGLLVASAGGIRARARSRRLAG